MKKILFAAAVAALTLNAQADVMKIALTDGTSVTYETDKVVEITFGEEQAAESIAGTYAGTQTVDINSMFTYTANINVEITENADGTINVTYPEYSLAGTMMGDLTLGAISIQNIPFDESKNAYYLDYSSLGLTQHFKAEKDGVATMDKDYTLGTTSAITVEKTATGIKIANPFKLGAMPFPLTSSFEGTK